MYTESELREVGLVQLRAELAEPVSHICSSAREEVLWAGTSAGRLHALAMPGLQRYSTVLAHGTATVDMVPLGGHLLSVSVAAARLHAASGMPCWTWTSQNARLAACAPHPKTSYHTLIAQYDGNILVLDVATGTVTSQAASGARDLTAMTAQSGRGMVALANAAGQVSLVDPLSGMQATPGVTSHAGGIMCLDSRDDQLATCGLGMRLNQPCTDQYIKVYDVRAMPRLLNSIAFAGGMGTPALLRFHPRFSSTMLVASAKGAFAMVDSASPACQPSHQVNTEGDLLSSVTISASGEAIAFGGSGGYVHIWSRKNSPSINMNSTFLELPAVNGSTGMHLHEDESFAAVPAYPSQEGPLLSEVADWGKISSSWRQKPPRVLDESLLNAMQQVDFVGHAANPFYRRSLPRGEAARLCFPVGERRRKPPQAAAPGSVGSRRTHTSDGESAVPASLLPQHLRRVALQQQAGVRFDDVDFKQHNYTRFVGLENDIANCYANPLLQVLYFIPEIREALLSAVPDASMEFSIVDEAGLLVRMLSTAKGGAVAASNVLRALRQSRQAAALGLLEGHAQLSHGSVDIEVEANKDRNLARRIQSLQRFLLQQLHNELRQRASLKPMSDAAQPAGAEPENSQPLPTSTHVASSSSPAGLEQIEPADGQDDESLLASSTAIQSVFSMPVRQHIRCLGKAHAEAHRDTEILQVDLQYPPAKDRPSSVQSAPQGKVSPSKPLAAATLAAELPAFPKGAARPSFADLLAASLQLRNDTRAWFSDELGYQYVRQIREPLGLPQVLAISCGMFDRQDLVWWQPWSNSARPDKAWLPLAIHVCAPKGSEGLSVLEGDDVAELDRQGAQATISDPRSIRATYKLTAVIAHIQDEGVIHSETQTPHEGHLVAHIKVLPAYASSRYGVAASPLASESPGQSPLGPFSGPAVPLSGPLGLRSASAAIRSASGRLASSQGMLAAAVDKLKDLDAHVQEAGGTGLPQLPESLSEAVSDPTTDDESSLVTAALANDDPGEEELQAAAAAILQGREAAGATVPEAQLEEHSASLHPPNSADMPHADEDFQAAAPAPAPDVAADSIADGQRPHAEPGTRIQQPQPEPEPPDEESRSLGRLPSFPTSFKSLTVSAQRTPARGASGPAAQPPSGRQSASLSEQWVLFNDICIQAEEAEDVRRLYGTLVAPCLLYYTQVQALRGAAARRPPSPAAPVLTPHQFQELCRQPPIQGALSRKAVFEPLTQQELPHKNMLVALDAEFVALSMPGAAPAGRADTRPARLALARVSVLRASGPQAGLAFMDDYIRASEPIADHLTKYSGIQAGDLDASTSTRHLVTAKAAYLKLRYLVDCGCVFVGHGLKKDFRMINIIVPPEQVVDTVELFHFKRQRKLSLRFLAAYLLASDIQSSTHDSIEDAHTALRLFQVYEELVSEGSLQQKLLEIYRWGKQNGWDAAALRLHTR